MDTVRVALVTGASSGIGKQVAKALAAQGWWVMGTGRNPARLRTAEDEIGAVATGPAPRMIAADLSQMGQVLDLVRRVGSLTTRLDLLVNNAGGMASGLVLTAEGLDANFAGNHLGPFLLTCELLPLLRRTAVGQPRGAVRILTTSSDASEMIPALDLDDLQGLASYNPGRAYCTGKLANVVFTAALADRLERDGIVAHAVHPGAVDSNFFAQASPETQARLASLEKLSEAEGADTLVWLATAPEGAASNGGYWHRRMPRTPHPSVADRLVRDRLWTESERLVRAALGRTAPA